MNLRKIYQTQTSKKPIEHHIEEQRVEAFSNEYVEWLEKKIESDVEQTIKDLNGIRAVVDKLEHKFDEASRNTNTPNKLVSVHYSGNASAYLEALSFIEKIFPDLEDRK